MPLHDMYLCTLQSNLLFTGGTRRSYIELHGIYLCLKDNRETGVE